MLQNKTYEAIFSRIPVYIECLNGIKEEYISATTIANALNLGEVQVRKDLAKISYGGKPKIGYEVKLLLDDLKKYMGYNILTKAVIVGMGRIGEALYYYKGFRKLNLEIVSAFDINGKYKDLSEFDSICSNNEIKIGIITVPQESAQDICDLMVKTGIKAIWNFSSTSLKVPSDVIVKNENMANSLSILIKLVNDSGK
ncbi:MAG: redox-sensing transcriptional repressor Rex [Candidatus Izemoplasmatales bacterium]